MVFEVKENTFEMGRHTFQKLVSERLTVASGPRVQNPEDLHSTSDKDKLESDVHSYTFS